MTTTLPASDERSEEARLNLYWQGFESLFWFAKHLLGYDRLGPLQKELCDFLQGVGRYDNWNTAMVCAYRGSYKSTCTSQAFPMWLGLYCYDLAERYPERWGHLSGGFSAKLIENSSRNAKVNHVLPLQLTFRQGYRGEVLQWIYQERIPEGFAGWNNEQIQLIQKNPLKKPTLTYWGLESAIEGWHGNIVICDDLEGADAQKSEVPSADAKRVWDATVPLLEEQLSDQRLLVGTPHGNDPLVYRELERERDADGNAIYDNAKRHTKIFWIPTLKRNGEPHEPNRYTPEVIARLKLDEEVWEEQFMLRRRRGGGVIFNEAAIKNYAFEYTDPSRKVIRYQTTLFEPDKVDENGLVLPRHEMTTVRVEDLRFYMHVDPKHRLDEQMRPGIHDRPSRAAIVVVGVAPDWHVFPVETWLKDAGLDDLAKKTMELFRKWNPFKVTFESIGAQVWFKPHIEAVETMHRRSIAAAVMRGDVRREKLGLRSISACLEESSKTTQSKEWIYRESLAPWINRGALHLNMIHNHELVNALMNVASGEQELDLIDALAQGPEVWHPPAGRSYQRRLAQRRLYVKHFISENRPGGGFA